jgi:uncharacterized membrane protein YgdD (TMEM256/DUF423 family)
MLGRMNWSAIGAVSLGLAVMLGAFGAHGLRDRLDAYAMSIWEKAVFYHFVHALGILVAARHPMVCALLFAGILIFSGSLYLLAFTGVRALGAVTPIGGVSFIAGWFLLAYRLFRSPSV